MPDPAPLDATDRQLLDLLQGRFPLVPEPFAALAESAGIIEDECLDRIASLRGERGVIRQISAIFDTAGLGYQTSLVAAAIDEDHLEAAAGTINAHPGVSHNYQRPSRFNLWYTVAVPPDSSLGLQGTVDKLHELSGAQSTRALPTLTLFKIGVRFALGDESSSTGGARAFTEKERAEATRHAITEQDQAMIRVLQQDLPIVARPFDTWAKRAGCTVDELLEAAQRYLDRKQMRRFAAVLHHRKAGAKANVMGVWSAPEDRVEEFGRRLAEFDAVSHCYRRPSYEDWPYNLYTMVHAADHDAALATLAEMQRQTGIEKYDALWSIREFKKVRVRYFTGEIKAWEAAQG